MKISSENTRLFFLKNWWLFYTIFFFLIGLLIYSLFLNSKPQDINNRLFLLEKNINECCNKTTQTNDSIRVRENNGSFGCLSFTLLWDSTDDIDLHVIDAKKDHIYFKRYCKSYDNSFSSAGGQLDIDLNAEGIDTDRPVENVYFKCKPPIGNYMVRAHFFEKRSSTPVKLKLTIRQNGSIVEEINKQIQTQDEVIDLINYKYEQR